MTTDTHHLSMEELSAVLSELPPRFRLGCVGDGRSPTLGDIVASPESADDAGADDGNDAAKLFGKGTGDIESDRKSVLSTLKSAIGIDLTRIAIPVYYNEP